MKKHIINGFKTTMRTVIVLLVATIVFFPYILVHVFLGLEKANKLLDKTIGLL